jgi:hypothetical protein
MNTLVAALFTVSLMTSGSLQTFAALFGGPVQSWGFGEIIIAIIIIAACVGIMYIALNVFGVQIPPWAIKIFWIVVVAFVAIFAIRLILGM